MFRVVAAILKKRSQRNVMEMKIALETELAIVKVIAKEMLIAIYQQLTNA